MYKVKLACKDCGRDSYYNSTVPSVERTCIWCPSIATTKRTPAHMLERSGKKAKK